MSRTYRDKARYHAKHYSFSSWNDKKNINEPEWWKINRFNSSSDCAKFWFNFSYRKLRRDTKRMIQEERYDEIPKKPINVDWMID